MESRPSSWRCPSHSGPELEGGVVKVGWWTHHKDATNRGLQWPFLPPRFPLPSHLFLEEVGILRWAWEAERKSRDHFR